MVVQDRIYTAEEFWQIVNETDDDIRLELVEGIIIEMPPSSPINTIIAGRILAFVFNFVEENDLGYVSGADGGYTLSPAHVRVPDVAFISKARLPEIPEQFKDAPDLVFEVISPSESARKVNDKTQLYLSSGVRMVVNVYPEDQVVEVWKSTGDGGMQVHTLTIEDVFDGGDVLPGFKLPVKKIFPK